MSLKGKVALVTGGSRGIGRAVMLRLASAGAGDIADLADFLASDAAGYITAQVICIGGGVI